MNPIFFTESAHYVPITDKLLTSWFVNWTFVGNRFRYKNKIQSRNIESARHWNITSIKPNGKWT